MALQHDSAPAHDIGTVDAYRRLVDELQARLAEAEETLDAIRSGEVDALLVGDADARRVFTLESADRPYRLLIEQMREGAVTLSADGLVLYCNQAFSDLVGTPAPQIVGTRFAQYLAVGGEALAGMLDSGGRTEIALAVADGGALPAALSLSALEAEDGRLVCGVVTDLSAARDLADTRQDLAVAKARQESEIGYRALLEQRVAERTGELARANDRLQIEMAERARTEEALRHSQKVEAIGQLTGGVAHDFNNMLAIIRGSIDMLRRRRELPEERRRMLMDGISDTVDRAAKLTGQLLAYARRQPLRPEVFDVGARIEGALEMLRTTVGPRIAVVTDASCPAFFVEADANQFETALLNMAVNARDAMDGEGVLDISVDDNARPAGSGEGDGAEFIAIRVTDSGVGIAPEKIERIFEPFFTTKGVGKGTGLGLSQVYGFAKQSGGEVGVESAVGEGASFTLYLPRVDRPAERERVEQPGAHLGRAQGHILLVEDNPEVGEVARQLLEDLGYTVTSTTDAGSAIALVDADAARFDLVFSDVVMPGGMSGVDLANALRARHRDLPVVLTTGFSGALADGLLEGVELLRKPYSIEALSRCMRRLVRKAVRP